MATTENSLFSKPGKVSVLMADGTFRELGPAVIDHIEPVAGIVQKWFTDERKDLSFTCEIQPTPESRAALRALLGEGEKAQIRAVVEMIRKVGRKAHFECRKAEYGRLNHIVHKHYNMNFTRYCRSIGIRHFKGFRVRLESGWWVWKK